jgi:hypothetical protein
LAITAVFGAERLGVVRGVGVERGLDAARDMGVARGAEVARDLTDALLLFFIACPHFFPGA